MNLHQIAASQISAVNPMLTVGVMVSVGRTSNPDRTQVPAYATPGLFTGSIAGTTLTVDSVAAGVLQPGQTIYDQNQNILAGTIITGLLTGDGGSGTYSINQEQTVAQETVQTFLKQRAQVQPLTTRDLRQLEGVNLQGTMKSIYLNGSVAGIVRPALKGGDQIILPNGSVWLVTVVPEAWNLTAGWTKAVITLQNDVSLAMPGQSDAQPAGAP